MASADIFNRKASVPDWMAKWWEFDQAFSAKVMAGGWRNMTKEQAIYGGIQGFLVLAVAACGAVSKDQQTPSPVDQLYSPSGEIVPINMFGQSEIFYSVQQEFIDLGLVAQQVQVVQLDNSDRYTAMQIMEVQDADGEKFYNLMFQGKNSQIKQEWAVLVDNTLFELDLVTKDGKREFVSNLTNSLGEITSTQLIIDTPEEDAQIPISLDSIIGLLSGVKPVLAADEATSTPISTATFTATQEPTFTPIPSDTPFVVDISPTKIKVTVAPTPIPATSTPEAKPTTEGKPAWMPEGSYPIGEGHWATPYLFSDPCPQIQGEYRTIVNAPYEDGHPELPWGKTMFTCDGTVNGPQGVFEVHYASAP